MSKVELHISKKQKEVKPSQQGSSLRFKFLKDLFKEITTLTHNCGDKQYRKRKREINKHREIKH